MVAQPELLGGNMERKELASELQELKKHFINQGICHVLSDPECRCPLCVLDDASKVLKRVRNLFERGLMSREAQNFLDGVKR